MNGESLVIIDPMPDGTIVLEFKQAPKVEGSGPSRRVVRDEIRTAVEFQPSAWLQFVEMVNRSVSAGEADDTRGRARSDDRS